MQDTNVDFSAYDDLSRRFEITKDARFQANIRLERRQKRSYFVISILSLFVILISLIPNMVDLDRFQSQLLLSITIVNSVFIIVTTFMEASGNFYHKGEQLHRSARSIQSVHNQLALLSGEERADQNLIQELQKKYQEALDECPFNHEHVDYLYIKIQKPTLFKNRISFTPIWIEVMTFIRRIIYLAQDFSWLVPHAFFFFMSVGLIYFYIFGAAITTPS